MSRAWCLGVALYALAVGAYAASPTTESFDSSLNGWGTSNTLASTGLWLWEGGTARLVFPVAIGPPQIGDSILVTSNNASGGSFEGNYYVAGVPMIGFDFIAETAIPSNGLYLSLFSGTNRLDRSVLSATISAAVTTQQWYRVMLSLDSEDASQWGGVLEEFETVVGNVEKVGIGIKRVNNGTHTCRVDNIFLTSVPRSLAVSLLSTNLSVTWSPLRAGATYRVEATDDLSGLWTNVGSFTAGASSVETLLEADSQAPSFRLSTDILQPR